MATPLQTPAPAPKPVAFIGAGIMGRGMVRTLLRGGYSLRVCNRTRAKAEEAVEGKAEVTDTPAEAVRGATVVFTMLADPEALAVCYEGVGGLLAGLAPGTVVIDCSTVSRPASQRAAERVRARGASFLDAPVTGSKSEAESGRLGFLVGGEEDVLESVREVLECLGTVTHMGSQGAGVCAKLVNNLVVAGAYEAFVEGVVMAARAGLEPERMIRALLGNPRARSGIAEAKASSLMNRDFRPFFTLKLMEKDLRLAVETARELGVSLPGTEAVRGVYAACVEAGFGEEDFSASIKHLERIAKVTVAQRVSLDLCPAAPDCNHP